MRVELDNQVDDHRVQLVVSAPFNTETSWSDTPFGVVERANTPAHLHDWREAAGRKSRARFTRCCTWRTCTTMT
ncbi:hypothetical protein JCM19237_803 [Photobacterium aphoticum]|uniref:Uncharacterized protein n=1 Tax=Photobacterium aphoticum TaxID=754436 RepID=A0A090QZG3_9GAMM|nr:hypothetical protein JCM19237_803 [Photobacterium aphoticum]